MGWLSEQVYVGGDSPKPEWKPVFLALTDKDMLLYDAVAFTLEDWASPFMSHPLLATRYPIFTFIFLKKELIYLPTC